MSSRDLIGVLAIAALTLSACSSSSSHSTAPTTSSSNTTPTSPSSAPTTSSTTANSTTTSEAVAATSSCYIGGWTSTNYAQVSQDVTTNGGAGIRVTISPNQMSIDFTGMNPVNVTGSISGQGLFTGTEAAPVMFSPSGTFTVLAKGTSNVTFKSKLASAASYSTPISANSFPSGGIIGTYNCSGSTLTLKVPTPQGPTTLTLTRS
jgi:hypothetical protein